MKNKKSYLYFEKGEEKSKIYLIAHDFVQVLGEPEGAYLCVVYRNYNGHGGKQTRGWVLIDSLEPIRAKLERKDLFASWNKSPCSEESCVVKITEEGGKLEVDLNSYLHDRPGESYRVDSVQESDGYWVLTHLKGSVGAPRKMEIEFGKTTEPGTINLIGPKGWAGTYHR